MNPLFLYYKLRENKFFRILFLLLAAIYIISPVDFVPDFIPLFGILDDGVVATILITEIISFSKYRKQKYKEEKLKNIQNGGKTINQKV